MTVLAKFDPWEAIGKPNPQREAELDRLDREIELAERAAKLAEPILPPPGSEARRVIDLEHERMVRGLLRASRAT
ncbi:MAG TPA: hypothetical protein PLI96_11860 [Halothiobacillus sp.]|nr:hypothetical protein [Halothiobacillus sp.]